MLLSLSFQIQILRDIRDKPGDETGDEVDRKLKYKHEREASSDDVPVLLVLLVRWSHVKITMVPEVWRNRIITTRVTSNRLMSNHNTRSVKWGM